MKITLDNYAAYILDYYEARLSVTQAEELMKFLAQYPDCMQEFEEFELMFLNEDKNEFSGKELLKKRTELKDEEYFALSEGDVKAEEEVELKKIIEGNSANERELRLWKAVKVSPDLSIKYPKKEKLKRRPVVVPLWETVYFRAAAVFVVILGSAALFYNSLQGEGKGNSFASTRSGIERFATDENNNSELNLAEKKNNPTFVRKNKTEEKVVVPQIVAVDSGKKVNNVIIPTPNENPVLVVTNNNNLQNDTNQNMVASHTIHNKAVTGEWGQEEGTEPSQQKVTFRRRVLDAAVVCLNGLKRIGVKKAEAVKKEDPDTGGTDYILVFGERSYSTKQN